MKKNKKTNIKSGRKPLDVKYALYLQGQGKTLKEIAKEMNCSYEALSRAITKYKKENGIGENAIIQSKSEVKAVHHISKEEDLDIEDKVKDTAYMLSYLVLQALSKKITNREEDKISVDIDRLDKEEKRMIIEFAKMHINNDKVIERLVFINAGKNK